MIAMNEQPYRRYFVAAPRDRHRLQVLNLEEHPMSKRASVPVVVALAALIALPATSEAGDCLGLHRVRDGSVAVVKRVSDGVVRVGDRMFGWIFCRHRRA